MDPMSIDHKTKPFCHNHMSDSKLLKDVSRTSFNYDQVNYQGDMNIDWSFGFQDTSKLPFFNPYDLWNDTKLPDHPQEDQEAQGCYRSKI